MTPFLGNPNSDAQWPREKKGILFLVGRVSKALTLPHTKRTQIKGDSEKKSTGSCTLHVFSPKMGVAQN